MQWVFEQGAIRWSELAELYRIAPLGHKAPHDLRVAFTNSRYKVFVFDGDKLIGAGRALADGVDCAYLCDVAIHPDYQGQGLGRALVLQLRRLVEGHRKVLLYAAAGKESFYRGLGFSRMRTAMAVFANHEAAVCGGVLEAG
jgi:ribosomal protein S18 acetylase RimI-like enzyme